VFSFIKKNCSNKIPKVKNLTDSDNRLLDQLKNNIPNLIKLMNNQDLNEFIKIVVSYSFDANKYFNDSEPWSVKKKDPERMKTILFTTCEQIKNISILLNSIIPIATDKVLGTMNVKKENRSINQINSLECFDHNKELKELDILFKKIEDDN
jgi:methionyl-tRNA synthetase